MISRPPLEGLRLGEDEREERKKGRRREEQAVLDDIDEEKERKDLEEILSKGKEVEEKEEEEEKKREEAKDAEEEAGVDKRKEDADDELLLTTVKDDGEGGKAKEGTEADEPFEPVTPKRFLGKMSAGKRKLAIIAILAMILIPFLYFVIIPRAEVVVTVQYAEGFQNAIFIDAKAENRGTRPVDDLAIKITVMNETDIVILTREMDASSSIGMWTERAFDFHRFQGNQRVNYAIMVDVEFDSGGRSYSSSDTFYTKDYMNQRFELTVHD